MKSVGDSARPSQPVCEAASGRILHLNPRSSLCQAFSGQRPTHGLCQLCLENSSRDESRRRKPNRRRRPHLIPIANRPLRHMHCHARARQHPDLNELRGSQNTVPSGGTFCQSPNSNCLSAQVTARFVPKLPAVFIPVPPRHEMCHKEKRMAQKAIWRLVRDVVK